MMIIGFLFSRNYLAIAYRFSITITGNSFIGFGLLLEWWFIFRNYNSFNFSEIYCIGVLGLNSILNQDLSFGRK